SRSPGTPDIIVSVVIPTYRRPLLLRRCLQALLDQTLGADEFEIVVVDDARDAHTQRLIDELAEQFAPLALRYLHPPPGVRGPAAARNAGWRAARADIIAFTDDDTIPAADWLAEGLAAMRTDQGRVRTMAAAGQVRVPISEAPTDYERNVKRLEQAEFVTANCFVRRRALEEIGGFDERFTRAWREDSDLHFNLLERYGGGVVHAARAVVLHPARAAPWGVSVREQRNMLFDALLFKKHPALYRARIRARPPLAYYFTLTALLIALAGLLARSTLFAGVGFALWL